MNFKMPLVALLFLFVSCSEQNQESAALENTLEAFKEGVHYELLDTPSSVRDTN